MLGQRDQLKQPCVIPVKAGIHGYLSWQHGDSSPVKILGKGEGDKITAVT